MVIHGRVLNGVVVLESDVSLPDGTEVTVVARPESEQVEKVGSETEPKGNGDLMSEEEHQRILEIMDRIAALPIEGDPEPFSGADHNKVLYGKP
jgi:hypothetical protein